MSSPFSPLLPGLCQEFGIDAEYWDIWGRHHVTEERTILAILASLGLATESPEELAASAARRRRRRDASALDPVAVLSIAGDPPEVPLRASPGSHLAAAIYWENGEAERWDLVVESGQTTLPLPVPLHLGYHDLEVAVRAPGGGTETRSCQRLIITPEKAWLPESLRKGGMAAGLAVSLYGLKSDRNWGAGDFTDLAELTRWVSTSLGAGFVALNPLHALHNRQPYNTSPYLPLSTYYRNFLYLDVEAVDDFRLCPAAVSLVAGPRFQAEIAALRASEFVEYERVAKLKRAVLRLLFRRFLREEYNPDTPAARAFRKWIAAEGDLLERFAVYSALDERLHSEDRSLWIWPDWPAAFRDPESDAVKVFSARYWRRVLFHKYVQWQIHLQLQRIQSLAISLGMPIGLYHDLALATDKCGSDLWAYRPFFVEGCRVGSPPDDFAPDGQDWAFPPPHSGMHRENGYRLFAESIRKNARHGGALRIDHVMRFFRLFWIPDGLTAAHGTYVNELWRDLLRILALESVRGRFLVIGEDLGTVPPPLREAMESFGMLRYKLFYFEKGGDGRPLPSSEYPRNVLVSSTTHDLPTLAGFWAGRDIEARRAAGILNDSALYERQKAERLDEKRRMIEALIRDGLLPAGFPLEAAGWTELTGELHNAVIGYLVNTPAMLMLLNEEDLTKEPDQQNMPGTTWQYPNWRRKTRFTTGQLQHSAETAGFAQMFRAWLERSGRLSVVTPQSGRR